MCWGKHLKKNPCAKENTLKKKQSSSVPRGTLEKKNSSVPRETLEKKKQSPSVPRGTLEKKNKVQVCRGEHLEQILIYNILPVLKEESGTKNEFDKDLLEGNIRK